ncbi:MAG: YfiR family protein, partial [Verrucomicrobiota bacterium]
MSRSAFLRTVLASAVLMAGNTFAEIDEPPPVPVPALKAGLVFGLTKLVIWPDAVLPATDTPLRLGVLGKHPFGDHLDRLAEKRTPKVRPITVVYTQDASALRDCQVVFVSRDRRE